MVEESTSQIKKRQVAYKVMIKDILDGEYTKEKEYPNFIKLKDNRQISRVNIIGAVIDKQTNQSTSHKSIIIDDGSANISLRFFDDSINIDNINIGQPILIIGRIREFGSERYILPEIIKKIENKDWIELRLIELNKKNEKTKNNIEVYNVDEEVVEDTGIFSLIKKLDKGEGADFNEVVEKSKDTKTEKILNNLIKTGELFEIRPGKIKVLE